VGTPTVKLKDKIEGDLDKQQIMGAAGMNGRKGHVGWTRWIQKETLRKEKLEIWKVFFLEIEQNTHL